MLQNQHDSTHLTLGVLLHYIFCRYSAGMEENVNKLHFVASAFVIHPQILIVSVFEIASFFSIQIANRIFLVTVLLLVYFCDQFLAPEIQTSLQCLSTINIVFSDENKILIKT